MMPKCDQNSHIVYISAGALVFPAFLFHAVETGANAKISVSMVGDNKITMALGTITKIMAQR
jgi:hypothetical protein